MSKKLNIKKLQTERSAGYISTKEALKDVTPFEWPDDVLSGKKKAVVTSFEGGDKACVKLGISYL